MNLVICHHCSPTIVDGVLPCPQTGRPAIDHAREGVCPLGKFFGPDQPPPPALPIASDAELAHLQARDRVAGPCCGG